MVSIIIDQYIKTITQIANDRFEKLRLNFKDALNTMKRIGLRRFFYLQSLPYLTNFPHHVLLKTLLLYLI